MDGQSEGGREGVKEEGTEGGRVGGAEGGRDRKEIGRASCRERV